MYFKDASKKKEKKKEHNVQFPPWVFIYICDFFLFVICDWMKKKDQTFKQFSSHNPVINITLVCVS